MTLIWRWAELESPPLSVTLAVRVWAPGESVRVKAPPVPICPSRSEVQMRLAVRVPSSALLAEPEKLMAGLG